MSRHRWVPQPLVSEDPADEPPVMFDTLVHDGMTLGYVIRFTDDGPCYGAAATPGGTWRRLGAIEDDPAAREAVLRAVGLSVAPPPRKEPTHGPSPEDPTGRR